MQTTVTIFGLLASTLFTVASAGQASVISHCNFDVICAKVDGVDPTAVDPGRPDQTSFNLVGSDGMSFDMTENIGQVIKCAKKDALDNLLQLEWTLDPKSGTAGQVHWDASLVNGNPFRDQGFHVFNNDVGFPQPPPSGEWYKCWDTHCAPGVDCDTSQVYTVPDSDKNLQDNPMKACPMSDNLVLQICL